MNIYCVYILSLFGTYELWIGKYTYTSCCALAYVMYSPSLLHPSCMSHISHLFEGVLLFLSCVCGIFICSFDMYKPCLCYVKYTFCVRVHACISWTLWVRIVQFFSSLELVVNWYVNHIQSNFYFPFLYQSCLLLLFIMVYVWYASMAWHIRFSVDMCIFLS